MAYHTFRDRHTCFIADFNTMFRQRFAAVDESRYGACLCTRRDGFTLIFEMSRSTSLTTTPEASSEKLTASAFLPVRSTA